MDVATLAISIELFWKIKTKSLIRSGCAGWFVNWKISALFENQASDDA